MLSSLGSFPTLSLWLAHRVEIREIKHSSDIFLGIQIIQLVPQNVASNKCFQNESIFLFFPLCASRPAGRRSSCHWFQTWRPEALPGEMFSQSLSLTTSLQDSKLCQFETMSCQYKPSALKVTSKSKWLAKLMSPSAAKNNFKTTLQVGTEEGHIYMATTEYSSAHLVIVEHLPKDGRRSTIIYQQYKIAWKCFWFLAAYCAHVTPVNTITWNPFHPKVFLRWPFLDFSSTQLIRNHLPLAVPRNTMCWCGTWTTKFLFWGIQPPSPSPINQLFFFTLL